MNVRTWTPSPVSALQRRGHDGRQRLSLARLHLHDPAAVQGEPGDDLHVERAQTDGPARGLAREREEAHAQRVERFTRASAATKSPRPLLERRRLKGLSLRLRVR